MHTLLKSWHGRRIRLELPNIGEITGRLIEHGDANGGWLRLEQCWGGEAGEVLVLLTHVALVRPCD